MAGSPNHLRETMKKYETLTGNKLAQKDTAPATATIQQRVTPQRKSRYVAQARREGMKLSEWQQKHLDAVCDAADAEREKNKNDDPV